MYRETTSFNGIILVTTQNSAFSFKFFTIMRQLISMLKITRKHFLTLFFVFCYLLHHFSSHCARRSRINYSKSPWNNYVKQGSLLSRKRVVSWIPERWVLLIARLNDKELSAFPALRIQAEVPFHLGIVCPYFSRVAVKPEYSLFCTQKSLVNFTFFFDLTACHFFNFFRLR